MARLTLVRMLLPCWVVFDGRSVRPLFRGLRIVAGPTMFRVYRK